MVRNRLASVDSEAAPSGTLVGLQALKQVEEGNGRIPAFVIARVDLGEYYKKSATKGAGNVEEKNKVSHTDNAS